MQKDTDHKEVFESVKHYIKRNMLDLSSAEYAEFLKLLRDYVKLLYNAWPEPPEYL